MNNVTLQLQQLAPDHLHNKGDVEFFLVLFVSGNVACTCPACTVNVGFADSRIRALRLLTYRRVLSVIFLAPTATKENPRSPSRERKLNLFSLFSQPEL